MTISSQKQQLSIQIEIMALLEELSKTRNKFTKLLEIYLCQNSWGNEKHKKEKKVWTKTKNSWKAEESY